MNPEKIVVNVFVERPVTEVWEGWVNPDIVRKWNIPFIDWHCSLAEIDFRIGGRFCFRIEHIQKKEVFLYKGQYATIVPYQLIEYTLDDKRKVSVEFQHIDQNTIVRETLDPEEGTSFKTQQIFCQSILERFKKYIETTAVK